MKIVLMDREGTIIVDPPNDRVDSIGKVRLLPHTLRGLRVLAEHGFGLVIITNQTNIAQGRLSKDAFWDLHEEVLRQISPSGINVLKTYVCPHNAVDHCICRKPKPELLLQAIKECNVRAKDVFMVGDRDTDVEAGMNAGTRTVVVKTGKHPVLTKQAEYTADNLLQAALYIVAS